MSECKKGYKGDCCCRCVNQIKLFKHPWNKQYKGSIMDFTGLYACAALSKSKAIIFEKEHGCCEMFESRGV